ITSNKGWKWEDILFDLGMRFSDIDHQGMVYIATTYLDLAPAKEAGRIAFVPWLEAATAIENEVDRVDVLYGFGVRGMGITYSEANALGSGLREKNDAGLSDLGRAVVKRMNRLGMTIDIAHCGDRTGLEVIAAGENPGEAMRNAVRWLVKHGYSDTDIAKIAGGNALRVLKETWAM